MKKIFFAFLFGLLTTNSYAEFNIHVVGEWASRVLSKFIPDKKVRGEVVDVYNEELEKNGGTLSAESVAKISDAAGWDRSQDKETRSKFRKELVNSTQYFEVCGDDQGKTGGDEHCVEDVFYAGVMARKLELTMLQADGLCKEYASVKYNDDIECSNETRGKINDYVKCTSKLKPIYYEFKFDSVTGSLADDALYDSVKYSVCKIHGTNLKSSGFNNKVVNFCDTSDTEKCSQINDSMSKFAYKSFIKNINEVGNKKNNKCVIEQKYDITKDNLRTAFGINNYNFGKGYQLSAYNDLREKLCEYIKKNANTTINACECDYNFTRVVDNSGLVSEADDVLTCYANEQPIDFIFDDLNENVERLSQGNMEAFNCSVLGGEYQGKTCYTPDKELCDKIAAATLSECPECKKAYWDEKANACVLPNATEAIQHQKNVNIALIAGGAAVNVGLTLYFGGTNWAYFVLVTDTLLTGMEFSGQMHIDDVADTFFTKANNCNNATCAEEILKEYFMYLARMTNDLQDAELKGVDAKFEKFVEMLPEDSQFLVDLYISGCYTPEDDNLDISKCDDGKWNTDQIIRAIGIAGQLFTLVGAGVKAVVGAERIAKAASKTPRLTKVLTKRIPGVKARIAQKLAKGEKVIRSDGKAIKALGATKTDNATKGATKTMNVSHKEGKQLVKAGKWADATVLDPTFDIKVTPLELGGKKYYLKAGNTETLIQNEISRTKQAHELLKHNKIVTSVGVVEDDQTVLKAFMDAHPEITLPRTPDTQYFIMDATHVNIVEWGSSDAEILGYLRNKPITIEEQNTILSELQNMNNNGLIHNDIWHNFAIYRDSGGKLHMELMDFGDFTSEEKLFRSNDDVLEIKKLFSKWSDRGLVEKDVGREVSVAVEKGLTEKVDNISVATSSVSATKTDVATVKGTSKTTAKNEFKAVENTGNVTAENATTKISKPGIEKTVITEENVSDIILHNHEVAKDEYDYVRRVYNSGPDGEEWVYLWENYAPRNQSLRDFQKIYGNDLNKAENDLKKLGDDFYQAAVDEVDKRASDLFDVYTEKHGFKKYKEYLDIRDKYQLSDRMTPETKGLENWSQAEINEAEQLYIAEQAKLGAKEMKESSAIYSTYDSRVAKINKKYEAKAAKFKDKASIAEQEYINEYGTNEGFEKTSKYKELKKEYQEVAEQYQYEIGKMELSNQEIIAQQMKYNLDELLSKYGDLGKRVDSWGALTKEEKINLLQDIIDTYAKRYNTPQIKILTEYNPDATYLAYYTHGTHNITFNTNAQVLDGNSKEVLGVLLHEYNHAIDYLTPNKGAVGAQIIKNKLFQTNEGPIYFLNSTEQSSFAVSGAVKQGMDVPLQWAEDIQYIKSQKAAKAAASEKQSFQTTLKPW